jgi:hypothetical protein
MCRVWKACPRENIFRTRLLTLRRAVDPHAFLPMPSVELTRLHNQIDNILSLVDRPEDFHRSVRDFLDEHSEHAYRAGEAVTSRPLLPSYRVPTLVYRQLEIDLGVACRRQPEQLLACAAALWSDDHLEPRLLAAIILGQAPPTHATAILELLQAWAKPTEDRQVLEALLDHGTLSLRRNEPDGLFELIHTHLDTSSIPYQRLALRIMEAIVSDPQFDNHPPIFRLLSPLILAPPAGLVNDLHHCLSALVRSTPSETAYFLRQNLGSSSDAITARLIRRLIPDFPPEIQSNLRIALRSRGVG